MKKKVVLKMGEMAVANCPNTLLQTFNLGSCVAVVLYHKATKTLAMAHVALPSSHSISQRSTRPDGYFADHAIPKLVNLLCENAHLTSYGSITAKIIGGTMMMDNSGLLDIGHRNIATCRNILAALGVEIVGERTGGKSVSRSVSAAVDTGKVSMRSFLGEKGTQLI